MKRPEIVSATQAELDEILALARTSFPDKQYKLLEGVLDTFVHLMLALQNAKTSIKRFRQMLFGAPTELKRKVLEDQGASAPAGESPLAAGATAAEGDQDGSPPLPPPPPQAGHGRNAAQAYRDAPIALC